ncbi:MULTISPECIES: FkbM family methyltransferase [unclassified Modestobacter]|uniref:FkbM family methyltransferase n=1 Tax=unclassified Modestobacter TaxID=2643866 RepID=UPI0022AA9852|nr:MULTISPECIES: FkbM family methyltransferase [unclassified Modestobacter]MCZ2823779.1 FkbM family methyltransferase [Modestobacter sp. VKM Ac-2981]MCZ2852024.1 FkbM family methyltransferase [Modestobacter sp. VKM Ac-2982]
MPPDQRFVSYAQNAEDVVLWRALRDVPAGRYVEVGANHPVGGSITRAFYDRGWSGIEIEPVSEFVEAFREARPNDVVVQAAITDAAVDTVTMHVIEGTGLSTLDDAIAGVHRGSGWATRDAQVPARRLDDVLSEHLTPSDDIHFMVVDTEGSERAVLATVDLRRWRPWVLVVEATAPNSTRQTHLEWEELVTAGGYEFCLFDGLSRFYVATERAAELREALSVPANPLDDFITHRERVWESELHQLQARRDEESALLRSQNEELIQEVIRWRGAVLARWASATGAGTATQGHEVVRLRQQLADTQATVSWRVTAPLRAVQSRRLRGWR